MKRDKISAALCKDDMAVAKDFRVIVFSNHLREPKTFGITVETWPLGAL